MTVTLGPVSAALEADLRDWARRHGIVIWLDVDGHYSAFVDELIALRASDGLTFDVRAFRGSYLELMLALETLTGGSDKARLIVHLPGHTEETVRDTPLLELYFAGARYRKSLVTLITDAATGSVRPEQIAAFLAQDEPSLAAADAWLAALLDEDAGSLAAQLRAFSILALIDDLLSGGFVSGHTKSAEGLNAIWNRLAAGIGLTAAWRDACLPADKLRPEDVAFAAAHWALCVEFVDDLRRPPASAPGRASSRIAQPRRGRQGLAGANGSHRVVGVARYNHCDSHRQRSPLRGCFERSGTPGPGADAHGYQRTPLRGESWPNPGKSACAINSSGA